MKKSYIILFAILFIGLTDINAQAPCNLTGGSVYIDHTSNPSMMNASVNGMSMYDYSWTDTNGFVISIANQTPFYSQWCVRITDNITGCDTIICQDCVADSTAMCICLMIYMPVCGCDGVMYSNSCLADCADVPWTPAVSNGTLGGFLPCTQPDSCEVDIIGNPLFCSSSTAQILEAIPSGSTPPFNNYYWFEPPLSSGIGLSTSNMLTINSPGTYCVIASDSIGCADTLCITVAYQDVQISSVPNPAIICLGDSIVLEPIINSLTNITWSPTGSSSFMLVDFPNFSTNYSLFGLDASGCERYGDFYVEVDSCFTNTHEYINNYITVFPNPTDKNINIKFNTNSFYNISIIDVNGREISKKLNTSGSYSIDVQSYASGLYFIKFENTLSSFYKKILIE